jgi:hypothetical protein
MAMKVQDVIQWIIWGFGAICALVIIVMMLMVSAEEFFIFN